MSIRDRSESRDGYAVRVLAVHTSEGLDKPVVDDAASLRDASWWVGSSHAIADDDPGSLLTPAEGCVPYERASWTLRSGNRWSENIELIAQAGWTRAQWLARPRLLDRCAFWLAVRSKVRGIPLVKLTPQQYRAGKSGVIGHHDHTVGYADGTHWDPGPGFPWDVVLDKARAYAAGQTPAAPAQEDDMAVIQAPGRGAAIVGPGYFKQLNPEEYDNLGPFGPVVRGNDRQYDLWVSMALTGQRAGASDAELMRVNQFVWEASPPSRGGPWPIDRLAGIDDKTGVAADVDEVALAAALAPKLNGVSQDEIAAALRQVLREGTDTPANPAS